MGISRELAARDASSQQIDGSRNYVSEANYIEFDGVKVAKNVGLSFILLFSSFPGSSKHTGSFRLLPQLAMCWWRI